MEARHLIPLACFVGAAVVLVLYLVGSTGGLTQEGFAVLLILCICLGFVTLFTQPQQITEDRSSSISGGSAPEQSGAVEERVSESELPDPLDEGFDAPLS